MDNLIEQLLAMKVEEKIDYQSILPLGKGIGYFAMAEYETNLNEEKTNFLKKLEASYKSQILLTEVQSARYFFNLGGNTQLEISTIVMGKRVMIVPYVLYFDNDIKEDIQRNVVRENKIYRILKSVGLQK